MCDVRQKEPAGPAPSTEVRRATPEVVRAPPDMSSYVAGVARAGGRARLLRAAEQASCRVGIRRRRGGTRGRWQGGVAPSQGVALNRLGGTPLL